MSIFVIIIIALSNRSCCIAGQTKVYESWQAVLPLVFRPIEPAPAVVATPQRTIISTVATPAVRRVSDVIIDVDDTSSDEDDEEEEEEEEEAKSSLKEISQPLQVPSTIGVKRDHETALEESVSVEDAPVAIAVNVDNVEIVNNVFEEAWKIITTPLFAVDPQSLNTVLTELGLEEKELLAFCESEDLERIANELRVIPKRKFLELFGK